LREGEGRQAQHSGRDEEAELERAAMRNGHEGFSRTVGGAEGLYRAEGKQARNLRKDRRGTPTRVFCAKSAEVKEIIGDSILRDAKEFVRV
jgi:hypothetical protein